MPRVTTMVLTVEGLQRPQLYKGVKKVLCSFDNIEDQVYDKEENKVTIKVVGYNPENMKEKILDEVKGACGGEGVSIEIIVPEKEKPKDEEYGWPLPPPPPPPALGVPVPCVPFVPCVPVYPVPVYPVPVASTCFRRTCCQECHQGRRGGPCFRTCCQECYGGRRCGPCFHGHNYNFGGPPPFYDDRYNGNWAKPVLNFDSYGGEKGNYFQPSPEYCSEPASGCQFM